MHIIKSIEQIFEKMVFLFGIFSRFGSFLTRFRKKKTVIETLEDIDKQIKDFEKYKQKNELNERKYIGALVLYSILLYILGAVFYYFYLLPKNLTDRVKTLIPFFISPVIIYSLRRFLKWFFIKRTTYYAKKLEDLREEKKTILEDVKEKETYKKAREILERFGSGFEVSITPPSTPSQNKTIYPATPFVNNGVNPHKVPGTTLVHRNVQQLQQQSQVISKSSPNTTFNNSLNKTTKLGSNTSLANSSMSQSSSLSQQIPTQTLGPGQQQQQQIPPPPSALAASAQARTLLPRPIITPNRTFFDKLLDFIIGEGPNNRYALICKNCHFHNGMALKEEFEYVAFRCAYCLFYNEARKTKLSVPKLNNKVSNEDGSIANNNESIASSTLSSSNSFDDINALSEPISSISNKSHLLIKSDLKRANSQGDSLNQNPILIHRNRQSSKSLEKLDDVKSSNDIANKENAIIDENTDEPNKISNNEKQD